MKNLSITNKIIVTFSLIFLSLFILVSVTLPKRINDSFTKMIIEELVREYNPEHPEEVLEADYTIVQYASVLKKERIIIKPILSQELQDEFVNTINNNYQKNTLYVYKAEDKVIYYTINRVNGNRYDILYIQATFFKDIISVTFRNIFLILILSFVFGLLLISIFSKYLTKPILKIEKHVKNIASDNKREKLILNQDDEIGNLAKNIEIMRCNLVEKEKNEKEMIQNVSHDLKTPIMVIKSYASSIKDDLYEAEEKDKAIDIIIKESERLEDKVRSLVYLNKLNIINREDFINDIDISSLLENMVEKYRKINSKIEWNFIKNDLIMNGEINGWEIVFENIFDNFLRYAKTNIAVKITNGKIIMTNDGDKIDEKLLEDIFVPYKKGNKGAFGLGLSIVYKTIEVYGYNITFENLENGVQITIY